jgi:hypothetical protein
VKSKNEENAENESEKLLGRRRMSTNPFTHARQEGKELILIIQTHPLGSGRPGRLCISANRHPGRGMARRTTRVDIPTRAAGKNTSRTAMVPIAT